MTEKQATTKIAFTLCPFFVLEAIVLCFHRELPMWVLIGAILYCILTFIIYVRLANTPLED